MSYLLLYSGRVSAPPVVPTVVSTTSTSTQIRNLIVSLTTATVPTVHAKTRFLEHRYEVPFRDWCEANPDSAMRRFSVRNQFNFFQPEMTNTDVEEDIIDWELMVGYPNTLRYGSGAAVDMDAAIQTDKILLKNAVGLDGSVNFTTIASFMIDRASIDFIPGDTVSFLRFVLPYRFFRSNT